MSKNARNTRKNLVCMLALSSLVLPSVVNGSPYVFNKVHAQEGVEENVIYVSEGNGGGAGTNEDPYRGIQTAIQNATDGATLVLKENVVVQSDTALNLNKNLTIKGLNENTKLELRGSRFKLIANITFKNLNLSILKDGSITPTFYVNGYKLEFDNVSTLVSQGQENERPEINLGTDNGSVSGTKSQFVVKGVSSESKFKKIVGNNLSIPTSVVVENSKAVITEGIELSEVASDIVLKTNNVSSILSTGTKDVNVTIEKPENFTGEEFKVKRANISGVNNLTLKDAVVDLSNVSQFSGVKGTLNVETEESKLIIPSSNFSNPFYDDEDEQTGDKKYNFESITGVGSIEIPEEGAVIHFTTPFDGNANIKINNIGELQEDDKVYVENIGNGTINFTYSRTSNNKIVEKDGSNYKVVSNVVNEVVVSTNPTKMTYIVGETFDPTGMVVTLNYEGGRTKVVPYENFEKEHLTITNKDTALEKGTNIVINYLLGNVNRSSLPLNITVTDPSEKLVVSGVKITKYNGVDVLESGIALKYGDTFSYDGIEVEISYENSTEKKVVTNENFVTEGISFNVANGKQIDHSDLNLIATYTKEDLVVNSQDVKLNVRALVDFARITKYDGKDIPLNKEELIFEEGDIFEYSKVEVTLRFTDKSTKKVYSDFANNGITFNIEDEKVLTPVDKELFSTYTNSEDNNTIDSSRIVLKIASKHIIDENQVENDKKQEARLEVKSKINEEKERLNTRADLTNEEKQKYIDKFDELDRNFDNFLENHSYNEKSTDDAKRGILVDISMISKNAEVLNEIKRDFKELKEKMDSLVVSLDGYNYNTEKELVNNRLQAELNVLKDSLFDELKQDAELSDPLNVKVDADVKIKRVEVFYDVNVAVKKALEQKVLGNFELRKDLKDKMDDFKNRYDNLNDSSTIVDLDNFKNEIIKGIEELYKDSKTHNILTINYKYGEKTVKTVEEQVEKGQAYILPNEIEGTDGIVYVIPQENKEVVVENDKTIDVFVDVKKYTLTINYKHDENVVKTDVVEVQRGQTHILPGEITVEDTTYVITQEDKNIVVNADSTVDVFVKKVVSGLIELEPAEKVKHTVTINYKYNGNIVKTVEKTVEKATNVTIEDEITVGDVTYVITQTDKNIVADSDKSVDVNVDKKVNTLIVRYMLDGQLLVEQRIGVLRGENYTLPNTIEENGVTYNVVDAGKVIEVVDEKVVEANVQKVNTNVPDDNMPQPEKPEQPENPQPNVPEHPEQPKPNVPEKPEQLKPIIPGLSIAPKEYNKLTLNFKYNGKVIGIKTVDIKVGENYLFEEKVVVNGVEYTVSGNRLVEVKNDKVVDIELLIVKEIKDSEEAKEIKEIKKDVEKTSSPKTKNTSIASTNNTKNRVNDEKEHSLTLKFKYNDDFVKIETVKVKMGEDYKLPGEITVEGKKYKVLDGNSIKVDEEKTVEVKVELEEKEEVKTENKTETKEKAVEKDKKSNSIIPIIVSILFALGLGGLLVFFKNKKSSEKNNK